MESEKLSVAELGLAKDEHVTRLDKSKRCFYNLQCGKCQDEYVRRTVGAVLFPQIYANEKQK